MVSENGERLYRVWSGAQRRRNAMYDAINHLQSEQSNRTLCGRFVTWAWQSDGDQLGVDFEIGEFGCRRCRQIAEKIEAAAR